MGRGRPQGFYIITEKGLALLVADEPIPWKFWRALMGYCYYNNEQITLQKVREFYNAFVDKYLKYSSEHGYGFNLKLFNQVSRKWVQSKIQHYEGISLDQRIFETLALYPRLTVQQLAMRIKRSDEDDIKTILSHYITFPHKPLVIDEEYVKLKREGKMTDVPDFYLHNLVAMRQDPKGIDTYELSLFGVILVLTIIRWNDMNRLKLGLHYNNISFEDYYDKIVSNYKNKLPLIFNKWHLLRRTLKVLAAYNFDIILDEEFRYKMMGELSVKVEHKEQEEVRITNGNKELYENARSILAISRRQLGEIQIRGLEESRNFIESRRRYFPDKSIEESRNIINKKTEAVSHLIWEITVLLDPLSYDSNSFKEKATQEWKFNSDEAESLGSLYSIETIERPFADEISFLYYLNLNDDRVFHVMRPMNYFSSLPNPNNNGQPLLKFPMQCLLKILDEETEIREWFSRWLADLVKYQQEILGTTSEFYNKVRIQL